MGQGSYLKTPLRPVARGVYSVTFPAPSAEVIDLECYLEAVPSSGRSLVFPATAPKQSQTLVRMERQGGAEEWESC